MSLGAPAAEAGEGETLPPRKWRWRFQSRWWRWLFIPVSAAAVTALVMITVVWQYYAAQAAKYDLTGLPRLSQGTRVLDREGNFVGTVFAGDRKFIKLDEAPQHLLDAVIA
ncbi:MAG TPA: hypothetical protein VD994_04450, partial [Prosthecobacter sp.]|nr:hypothetical protein [Prosthecobacter sp.]